MPFVRVINAATNHVVENYQMYDSREYNSEQLVGIRKRELIDKIAMMLSHNPSSSKEDRITQILMIITTLVIFITWTSVWIYIRKTKLYQKEINRGYDESS